MNLSRLNRRAFWLTDFRSGSTKVPGPALFHRASRSGAQLTQTHGEKAFYGGKISRTVKILPANEVDAYDFLVRKYCLPSSLYALQLNAKFAP